LIVPPSSPAASGGAKTAAPPFRASGLWTLLRQSASLQLLLALCTLVLAAVAGQRALLLASAALVLLLALIQLLPPLWRRITQQLDDGPTARVLAVAGLVLALPALALACGWLEGYLSFWRQRDWEAIAAIGEGVIGAFGQILVALVALMIAWRQVMVDQRLTTQQNRITQAQTIDNFIHGISELICDEEGLLEDWPLERMLAEGRLAAVLGSIDAEGKARVLRFLSHARLLTPLRRDHRLGRAILDGQGGYEVDREKGLPVIHLQHMLRGVDLAGTDLRGVDFNGANLRGVDLSRSDLSEANLAGADLSGARFEGARLEQTRFFFGDAATASPANASDTANHQSGAGTGAVVENANFSAARQLDAASSAYLAAWGGARTRATLPAALRLLPPPPAVGN